MAKLMPEKELRVIEAAVAAHPEGIGIREIGNELEGSVVRRTLQYRLKYLVDEGRLVKENDKRWTKYRLPVGAGKSQVNTLAKPEEEPAVEWPISIGAADTRKYVRRPVQSRERVGYKRSFLNQYRPNETAYLSDREQAYLNEIGGSSSGGPSAGAHAKQILSRLFIDLSWNSSRLEGNTYSLLDAKRLINFGKEAEGKEWRETQMILNHKDAIEFLTGSADEIGFNRCTILNLHALLANNLLADPDTTGRLRQTEIGIEGSAFHPLEAPQMIEECFDQILATARVVDNPFEQAFFIMAHLSYLQPFDNVNKRVSRLAANIPLIKANLTPLSFTDVPTTIYTEAMLGVYELNRIDFLKDAFIWAYKRSVSRYAAVWQSLDKPDPFRLKYRSALHDIVRNIVLGRLDRKMAFGCIAVWSEQNINASEQDQFRQIAESEVLGLHEGNFARYQIKPSQFSEWWKIWKIYP